MRPIDGERADNITVSPGSDLERFLLFAKSLVPAWLLHKARGGQGQDQRLALVLAGVPPVPPKLTLTKRSSTMASAIGDWWAIGATGLIAALMDAGLIATVVLTLALQAKNAGNSDLM